MNNTLSKTTLAAALALGALPAFAGTQVGDYLNFSGFGTLGLARTNTDSADFVRDRQSNGATTRISAEEDSNFGLQLTATANPWLSATVQMLSLERTQSYMTTELEWAFVKVKPFDGLTVRGGRMALPVFAVSDSRNVGYANNWLRPPGEVYGLAMLSRLDGGDVTYAKEFGGSTLTATAMVGKSIVPFPASVGAKTDNLHGLNLQWESDGVTVRLGQVRTNVHLATMVDKYKFSGAGVVFDRNNIVAQAEYVTRRSASVPTVVNSNGWYVLGGYHLANWLPYASYGSTKPKTGGAPFYLSGPQHTTAVGARWDAMKSLDVKFQLERINTDGSKGVSFTSAVAKPVTAASIAVDFVF